jgi:general secretion pathway protein F
MPVYEYTALNRAGKRLKGIVDADSAMAARHKLRDLKIFPVALEETSTKPRSLPSSQVSMSTIFRRVRPVELSALTRQLATLMGAGISLVSSLEALIAQITNPMLKKIMAHIKESVNEGNSLAFSLSQHPRQFSQVYINMVRAGEASGSLDLVLDRLSEYSEHHEALKGRLRAAMVYPIIMSIIGVLALMLLVTFVIPRFVEVFGEMEQALPLPTLLVIGTSNVLKSFWWVIVLILIVFIVAFRQFIKTPRGRYIWDGIKLTAPIIGLVNIKMAMARFARTLGSLTQSGVPLISSLEIVRNIVNNNLIADDIDRAMEEIQEGKPLATPLAKSKWVTPVVIQMISVGEQSGELERMLNKIADIYEQEVESQVTAMTSMLEPVMILVMAVIVGFIAFSVLLPILEMSQMVH